jgi:hypothetical protein
MSQLRTSDMLLDFLDGEMAWRIKEIHQFKVAVETANGKNVDAHVRAGVAMLYAHWEGFIKSASNAYVNYLSHKAPRNSELKPCFVAMGMKAKISASQVSSKATASVEVVDFLLAEMDKPVQLPKTPSITAESNLSSSVFANIVLWIGIDSGPYETRFPLIDATLLDSRNRIAHGEFLSITPDRFVKLVEEILEMLRWFKTDIENAAVEKKFLRVS